MWTVHPGTKMTPVTEERSAFRTPYPSGTAEQRKQVEEAIQACEALLAFPKARSGLDGRRRQALMAARDRLEAGDDLAAALAFVQTLFADR